MPFDEPPWWYDAPEDVRVRLLRPVGRLWGLAVEMRFAAREPYRSRLPVICIGNLTAGGTGKTPLAILVARHLALQGENPVLLTRGYGGRTAGPHWVDPLADTAAAVGDEPLLLSRAAPVLVSRCRRKGILAIERGGRPASVVIMDDGLQNPALKKDLTIAVVDGRRGLGNGDVIPAGPLRAPLNFQLGLVDAIAVNGPCAGTGDGPGETAAADVHERLRRVFPGPVLAAATVPDGETSWLSGKVVVAYAGIGNPRRFFDLAARLGARIAEARIFPDHHPFSERDAQALLGLAEAHKAELLTTEKDWVRLAGLSGLRAGLRERSRVLPVRLTFAARDASRLAALIETAAQTGGYRQGLGRSPARRKLPV